MVYLLCVAAHSGNGIACCVGSESVCAISQTECTSVVLFFEQKIVLLCFFRQNQVKRVCVHFKFVILVSVTERFNEIVMEFQHSLFSIPWM